MRLARRLGGGEYGWSIKPSQVGCDFRFVRKYLIFSRVCYHPHVRLALFLVFWRSHSRQLNGLQEIQDVCEWWNVVATQGKGSGLGDKGLEAFRREGRGSVGQEEGRVTAGSAERHEETGMTVREKII